MNNYRRAAGAGRGPLFFLVFFLLPGCVFFAPPSPPPLPKPPKAALLSPRRLLNHFESKAAQLKNLQAIGNIQVESWGESKNINAVLVLERPASIRLEFLSFIGQPLQFLVCHEGRFWLYAPGQARVMTGEANRFNLYRLLGVNMELEEILNILFAAPALEKNLGPLLVQYLSGDNTYLLEAASRERGMEQSIWLEGGTLRPKKMVIRYRRQVSLQVEWEDYREVDALQLPTRIHVRRPQEDTRLEISYSDYSLNAELESRVFALQLPQNAEYIDLSAAPAAP